MADRIAHQPRARHLAGHLRSYPPPPQIVCHGDIHVGNVLITPDGMLYLVDWDTLVYAPKERDLMFVGAGLGSSDPLGPDAQAALFYEGYGPVQVDLSALAYYRCERIVEDIAAYCDLILLTLPDNTDRANGLAQLASQFAPEASWISRWRRRSDRFIERRAACGNPACHAPAGRSTHGCQLM
ncbi:MAG: phosphotransferase [Chloroflexi bacterium]|nr:phosphotransferase [Chloroflexota bacterium]